MIYHFEEGSQECRIEFRDRTILLTVINEAVCRVTALNRGEQKPQRSAAIEGDKQKQTAIRIQKEETGIRLFTDKIQIAVEEDGRIGFFDREGRFLTGYLSEGEESGSCGEELTEQQKAFIGREGHETADAAENAVSVPFFFVFFSAGQNTLYRNRVFAYDETNLVSFRLFCQNANGFTNFYFKRRPIK